MSSANSVFITIAPKDKEEIECNCLKGGNSNSSCANNQSLFSTIYLVRHGQTVGNAYRVFLDPAKEVLSPKGILQATALGEHLSDIKFDKVYSSSLVRARNTTKIILQHSKYPPNKPVTLDERIKEVDFGIFRGRSYDETQKIKGQNVGDSYPYKEFYVEGTEEIELVLLRLNSFLNELFAKLDKCSTPQTILIVSHANLIRIFMKYVKLSPEKFRAENFTSSLHSKCLKNTAYHKFEIELKSPNCNKCKGTCCKEPRIIRFCESHNAPHLEKTSCTSRVP